jgi:signal peptidase II
LRKFIGSFGFLLSIASVIVLLDQWTKFIVRQNLQHHEIWTPWTWLGPYFSIVHVRNTGAAFGMLQQFGGVFTILAIVVSLVIIYYYPRVPREDWPLRLAMGFQLGGAAGNLVDRLVFGYVTDFIVLLPMWNFPVFNIADLAITIGVIVLVLGIWIKEREEKKDAAEIQEEPERLEQSLREEKWGE